MIGFILMTVVTICTLFSYIPQSIKLFKTKKSEDLSIGSWLLWATGALCYEIYVLLESNDYLLIFIASLEMIFCLLILMLSIIYRKNAGVKNEKNTK